MDIPATCVTISEFHDVKDLVFTIKVKDADDPTTPNGRMKIRILSGNELGLYKEFTFCYSTRWLWKISNETSYRYHVYKKTN